MLDNTPTSLLLVITVKRLLLLPPTILTPSTKVEIPVANISPSGLKVIPVPTFVVLFAVSVLVVSDVTIPVVAVRVVTIPVTI